MTGHLSATRIAVRSHLLADAGVSAEVDSRVYSGRPKNPTLPYIIVDVLPALDFHGLGFNEPAYKKVRVQIMTVGVTQTEAEKVMDAVMVALDGATIDVTGWGTPRFEGYYGPFTQEEEIEGVRHYYTIKRWEAVYAGVNVS